MSPESHSPKSDPGPTAHSGSADCNPSCSDERFAYKNRRREQRKKPASFPKTGGPSILVYVKDDPRKNSNRNTVPYHMYHQLPVLPHVTPTQGYDPLRVPYLNPSLLMMPPLPPLPPHLLPNTFPHQRQRYNSSPTLRNYTSPPVNYSTQRRKPSAPDFAPNQNTQPPISSVPVSLYPHVTNPSHDVVTGAKTAAGVTQLNPASTTAPQFYFPPYYSLSGAVPSVPLQNNSYQNQFTPQNFPKSEPQAQTTVQNSLLSHDLSASQSSMLTHDISAAHGSMYVNQGLAAANSSPDTRTYYGSRYATTQTQKPMKTEQTDSSSPTAPPAEPYLDPSYVPVANRPSVYPNVYMNKCDCDKCSQISPTDSGVSSSINDSGFGDAGPKTFSELKDDVREQEDQLNTLSLNSGERPLLSCDQNNPTFSLDPDSLARVMGMAHRENLEQNEQLFLAEKRQIRKKIPCRNLSQTGYCHFGETCWFNHHIFNN